MFDNPIENDASKLFPAATAEERSRHVRNLDLYTRGWEPVGRIKYDGSNVCVMFKPGLTDLREAICGYVGTALKDGVVRRRTERRCSKGGDDEVLEGVERIRVDDERFWSAMRDGINGHVFGGKRMFAFLSDRQERCDGTQCAAENENLQLTNVSQDSAFDTVSSAEAREVLSQDVVNVQNHVGKIVQALSNRMV